MTEQRNNYETEMISIVAHDLKAPISAVRGFIELIEQTGPLNEQQEHFMNRAFSSLARMEQMIESLLNYVRVESGGMTLQLEPLDIGELITYEAEMMGDVATQNNIKIHFERKDTYPTVAADSRLIGHVVANLLSNAIKYNKKGGEVWVTVTKQAHVLRVDVRDNGIGIPPKRLPYVFDRFVRAHEDSKREINGTGLGLAICRSIINMHKGHIWVESVVDQGSVFSFTLPLQDQPKASGLRPRVPVEMAGELDDPIDDDTQESSDDLMNDSKDVEP